MILKASLSAVSIVVATRNRAKALEMSLPLMLKQTHPPKEIFIVDSSDNPEPIRSLVNNLKETTDIPLTYISSAPGLTRQRNVGLAHVSCPIVAFPDDDSLMFPTYLEEIAKVYATDEDELLVGVTVEASTTSPLSQGDNEASDQPKETYAPKSSSQLKQRLVRAYTWCQRRVAPIPYVYLRREIQHGMGRKLPPAIEAHGCILVPDQEGFRMSFRTKHLRKAPFNRHMTGYSLGEDIDVCYGLAKFGMIARMSKSLIFHHEFPGARANGRRWGIMQPINIAYIATRHTKPGHPARKAVGAWTVSLIIEALLQVGSVYQRERLQGIWEARRKINRLVMAPCDKTDEVYVEIMDELEAKL